MSTQHTPGPWAVSPDHIFRNQADIFEIHWSAIGECIAECVHGEANARLIAAAPELLEALKEYIAAGENSVTATDDVAAMIRFGEANKAALAAIAKATGDQT